MIFNKWCVSENGDYNFVTDITSKKKEFPWFGWTYATRRGQVHLMTTNFSEHFTYEEYGDPWPLLLQEDMFYRQMIRDLLRKKT